MIEKLEYMKSKIMDCTDKAMEDLKQADTKELGEAIDMIKDLSEAIYYCTITQSMKKVDENKSTEINYYTTPVYQKMSPEYWPPDPYRDTDREGRYTMYYPNGGNGGSSGGSGSRNSGTGASTRGSVNYYPAALPSELRPDSYGMMRDPREGRSAMRRRMYMEGKETHNDPNSQLKELEAYLQELSSDVTEMVKDASPEERAILHQKMTTLANKLA